MIAAIRVRELSRTFSVPAREAGTRAALRGLIRREVREVVAVDGVGFDIAPGEVVGFLGPNGAGKTTTLKMLAGLLYPTAGEVTTLGHRPWRRERAFLRRIALVMGQRSQLVWDLPVADSFELHREIYGVAPDDCRRRVGELAELLELGSLLRQPARTLSLGERMKCELAVSLLHRPQVLFLDEPTLGLDVTMQARIRAFLRIYQDRHAATLLLTSHYMADVEALCRRVIVIHRGRLLFDGDLAALVRRFAPHKTIVVELSAGSAEPGSPERSFAPLRRTGSGREPGSASGRAGGHAGSNPAPFAAAQGRSGGDQAGAPDLRAYGTVVRSEAGRVELRVPKEETPRVTARLLADLPVIDLIVADPPIEETIARIFAGGEVAT
jgi:ABC-2 type transport system ATP-binding protein